MFTSALSSKTTTFLVGQVDFENGQYVFPHSTFHKATFSPRKMYIFICLQCDAV
jgi:hypothetical protein